MRLFCRFIHWSSDWWITHLNHHIHIIVFSFYAYLLESAPWHTFVLPIFVHLFRTILRLRIGGKKTSGRANLKLVLKVVIAGFLFSLATGFFSNPYYFQEKFNLSFPAGETTYGAVMLLFSTVLPFVVFMFLGRSTESSAKLKSAPFLLFVSCFIGFFVGSFVYGWLRTFDALEYYQNFYSDFHNPGIFVFDFLIPTTYYSLACIYVFFVGFAGLLTGSNRARVPPAKPTVN